MKLRFYDEVRRASALEETLGRELDRMRIPAWCRILVEGYEIDLAIFCSAQADKKYKIDVEADGIYHTIKERQLSDSRRDDMLRSNLWTILRFKSDKISYRPEWCVEKVCRTITELGGSDELKRLKKVWYTARHIPFPDRPKKLANDLFIEYKEH